MDTAQAKSLINEQVRALQAYHLTPEEVPVKLNQNENPFDRPASVKAETADYCLNRPWNRYPPFIPEELKAAIAQYTGLSPECVIAGNGSNEMLLILLLALTAPDRTVITVQPTFTVYRLLARGMGRGDQQVYLDKNLRFDASAIRDAVKQYPGSMMVLCSPNNPTGCSIGEEDLRSILAVHTGFLILDQAYVEFGGFNGIELLDQFPNLVITRTFSKGLGGAGLRLGYMLGSPEIIAEINKIKLPYNINFLTEFAGRSILSDTSVVRKECGELCAARNELHRFLCSIPALTVYESDANFILIRTAGQSVIAEDLRRRGVLVRDVSGYPMLDGCLRISVGSTQENRALTDALTQMYPL